MRYCARCLYPENAKPTIIFDDECVCSGCRYHESREKLQVNWEERQKVFEKILQEARVMAKERGNLYDCIVPVSGGKDSHYQVWTLKEKYGMNPLLVNYNHVYNTEAGLRNLENLVEKSGCDLIMVTTNPHSVQKVSRFMLETVGDLTWHYHAGIRTVPFQVAVEKNIPLMVWGEHGFAELTGIVSLEDFVEFTKWTRREHDMRGFEPEDVVARSNGRVQMKDLSHFVYPTDDQIEKCEVRGIYMSNFFPWNAKKQGELMMEVWDFKPIAYKRDRTFLLYGKIEDHANDVHDYLKFLKFGYGRATDDASMEIRHGRMTREEGIEMVNEYDATEPTNLPTYLDFLKLTKTEFYDLVEKHRDPQIWQKNNGKWEMKDHVSRHTKGPLIDKARVKPSEDRTFGPRNRHLYYNNANPPLKTGDARLDVKNLKFKTM